MNASIEITLWQQIRKVTVQLAGLAIEAFGITVFILPFNLVIGGPSGIGRMLNLYFGCSVSFSVAVINILLFLLGLCALGKSFASSIVVGTFGLPAFMKLFESFPCLDNLTDDPLLGAIAGGFLIGIGVGIVIRDGGSTGGSDVLPIVLNKKFRVPLAPALYGMELIVMIWQAFQAHSEEIILGILMTLIYITVMNQVLVMGKGRVQILIFSPKAEEINSELMKLGVGATMFHGKTGYRHEECDTIICVVSSRYLYGVRKTALQIDPTAFITVSGVQEVNGRGFTF